MKKKKNTPWEKGVLTDLRDLTSVDCRKLFFISEIKVRKKKKRRYLRVETWETADEEQCGTWQAAPWCWDERWRAESKACRRPDRWERWETSAFIWLRFQVMLVLKNQLKERSIKILQPQILIEVSDYARLFKKLGFFFFFFVRMRVCVCVETVLGLCPSCVWNKNIIFLPDIVETCR